MPIKIEYYLKEQNKRLCLRLTDGIFAGGFQGAEVFQHSIEMLLRSDLGRSKAWNTLCLDLTGSAAITCGGICALIALERRLADRPASLKLIMRANFARRLIRIRRINCLVKPLVAEVPAGSCAGCS